MGQLLEDSGFPAIPSKNQPFQNKNEKYFWGGYNVRTYSQNSKIDAIQFELNKDLRWQENQRKHFCMSVVKIFGQYLKIHYGF